MERCAQCGAPGGTQSCTQLYHHLLVLDFSRREPWGPHHGVTTACYLLQHANAWLSPPDREHPWILIHAFLDGGLPHALRFIDRARIANSHRRGDASIALARPETTPPQDRSAPTRFEVTIADLAVDGTFPAADFTARTRPWAAATRDAWLSA
jgi:hypothetical protein